MSLLHLRLLRTDRGTAAVEMALILPMAMALLFGGFEAGNYMLTEHKVIKGVRDGARYAARLSFDNFDCSGTDVPDPALTQIRNVTRTGNPAGGRVRVNGWGSSPNDVTVTMDCDLTTNTGLYRDRGSAPRVLVATRVNYPSILGLLGFDTRGAVVRAQAQAAVMGI
jgi:hypothetical protein